MQLIPVGHHAVLVEVGSAEAAVSLATWARERGLARDVVPGAETVLFDGVADRDVLSQTLTGWRPQDAPQGPLVEVPVVYDGPDLEDVAARWGCSADEVATRHQATSFVAAFCGFAPGFAYLSGLDVQTPRLATPRTRVPAGSVALAGSWCGVYPTQSPGGWRIIGRTNAVLWDATRSQPALLAPGTRVRFVPR
ncbi:MAG TPA: allophanate hydrolase subunit 1 [Nocardioides sp.]|nr:allophanate hydrolase subunit 1 [Nocardioides sp.]